MNKIILFLSICTVALSCSSGNSVVSISDFGAVPDSGENILPAMASAIRYCRETGTSSLVFPKGRYDIWPVGGVDSVGIVLKHLNDFTLDGGGSEFVFHGAMEVCRVDSCSNVAVTGFSVDWDRPFISQAVVKDAAPDHLDIQIDSTQYPYVIEDSRLLFIGEGWKMPVIGAYNNLYDKDTGEILYNTWDSPLGDIFSAPAIRLEDGSVRLSGKVGVCGDSSRLPEPGTYASLYHFRYYRNGFTITNSKDIMLKDICLFHTLSHGVVGLRTENITMDNCSATVNDAKGRVFSLIADASHFNCCRGTILVQNCCHTGQGDDFINVHGRNARIDSLLDNRTVKVRSEAAMMQPGDTVWLVDRETAQRGETLIVDKSGPGNIVSFTTPLPEGTELGDVIENKTWTASLVLRNCRIDKRHRARGILVTTPKDVVIEDNYFHSAGTAILIEGDTDVWFESGGCTNVEIRNNIFDNCLTSGNRDGDRWQWGEAVITVTPSHSPADTLTEPYHHGIRIHDNTFKVFDMPLLHARSVGGLTFTGNRIIKTDDYAPYTWQRESFFLEGCRDVSIMGNEWDNNYTPRDVRTVNMGRGDIITDEFMDKIRFQ